MTARTSNYTTVEKGILTGIVDRHKAVVENKKTDAFTTKVCAYCYCTFTRSDFADVGARARSPIWKKPGANR